MPTTLKTRAEFLRIRGGFRASCPACVVEARQRAAPTAPTPRQTSDNASFSGPRFGFTVTKKIGNAVVRNRIRRRLKAAIATLAPDHAIAGLDYVIVARRIAGSMPFATLQGDLTRCLDRVAALARKSALAATNSPAIDST